MLALLALALAQNGPPAPPTAIGPDEFPAYVWRDGPLSKRSPADLDDLVPMGGVIVLRTEDCGEARSRGLATLIWNAAGRTALHLDADESWRARVDRWIATRAPELLVRRPCLSDPDVVRELEATLENTLQRHHPRPGTTIVLGDEVGLTPDGAPFDFCRAASCEAAWRAWAAANDWPALAPDTDSARHALGRGRDDVVGAWLARRRFDRGRLTALLDGLAQRTRAAGFPVALLGMGGSSVFGGLDLAALGALDITETYPRADARLLERRREPSGDSAALTTLFLEEETPDGAAWLAFEHWSRGGRGLVLWSEAALREPARRARLEHALTDIRALVRRPDLRVAPADGTVAVLHDPDALAFDWLNEHRDQADWPRSLPSLERRRGAFPRKAERWQRALARLGREPTAVTLEPADAARRARVRLLVLIETSVLDPGDLGPLAEHLERGGVLVVDGRPATIDRRGRPWRESWLAPLVERAPGRVFVRDSDALPLDPAWLERVEAAAVLVAPPWPVLRGEGARRRWRRTARPLRGAPGSWRVTLMPDVETPLERARELETERLELEAPAGWRLEWVHPGPEAGGVVPAGDAAVVVVRAE